MTDQPSRPGYRIPYPRDPFELYVGPFWTPEGPEPDGRVTLTLEARHCNGGGAVHGGMLATMSDLALCWVAVMDLPDERVVTVSLTTDYLSGAEEGETLVAKPELIRRTGSLAFCRCEIRAFGSAEEADPGSGAEGRVVSSSTAVLKRMRRTPR